jgi:hypothetical protein
VLAVTHPELFNAIVDLDGQLGPNAGKKQQTIARLFGGDADAWAAFDPRTVVQAHSHYSTLAAWIGVSAPIPTTHRQGAGGAPQYDSSSDWDTYSEDHSKTGNQLCELLSGHGIECSVMGYPGGHDFPSAAAGFSAALPWLAGRLGTPGVHPTPLPGPWCRGVADAAVVVGDGFADSVWVLVQTSVNGGGFASPTPAGPHPCRSSSNASTAEAAHRKRPAADGMG